MIGKLEFANESTMFLYMYAAVSSSTSLALLVTILITSANRDGVRPLFFLRWGEAIGEGSRGFAMVPSTAMCDYDRSP